LPSKEVDNCQVAVFGVLSDGQRHAPVDMRLYLPKAWIGDPAGCEQAGIPPKAHPDLESDQGIDLEFGRPSVWVKLADIETVADIPPAGANSPGSGSCVADMLSATARPRAN
jgi:hypothetical protein